MSSGKELKNKALEYVRNSKYPLCIGDLSKRLGISWATARYIVLMLVIENKIELEKTSKGLLIRKKEGKQND